MRRRGGGAWSALSAAAAAAATDAALPSPSPAASAAHTATLSSAAAVDDATSSSQIAPVYAFLKQPPFDGEIPWNYTKFLVGRDGKVLRRYSPGSPFEQGMEDDVKRALKGEPLKERRNLF